MSHGVVTCMFDEEVVGGGCIHFYIKRELITTANRVRAGFGQVKSRFIAAAGQFKPASQRVNELSSCVNIRALFSESLCVQSQ